MNAQPIVASPEEVLIHFLPFRSRAVRPHGISLWELRYWHEDLADLINDEKLHEIRYDPRDITYVYVRGSTGVLCRAALVTPDVERMSLWEWNRIRRVRRQQATSPAHVALKDAALDKADKVLGREKRATRAARRSAAVERERVPSPQTSAIPTTTAADQSGPDSVIDFSKPAPAYRVEVWD
jgi:hypothetical protein